MTGAVQKVITVSAVFLIVSVSLVFVLIAVWLIGFFGTACGQCNTLAYSIEPGTSCPWPDQCQNSFCVLVRVVWYPTSPAGITHTGSMITPKRYSDCWTTDPYAEITVYLQKEYPLGVNQTCFVDTSFSDPNHLTFGSVFCDGPRVIFIIGLVCAIVGIVSALFLVFSVFVKRRQRIKEVKYEIVSQL
jgi:hypothetical protein